MPNFKSAGNVVVWTLGVLAWSMVARIGWEFGGRVWSMM